MYQVFLSRFLEAYSDRDIDSITSDEILSFLTSVNKDCRQSTKRLRYTLLKAFFNHIKNTVAPFLNNPCDTAVLRKLFRNRQPVQWKILERDVVDEMIFKTTKPRNRLVLELMAKGGMRIGEVLKIRPRDVDKRKITLVNPKSGRAAEVVYIPQKIADRLQEYVIKNNVDAHQRIFPLTYSGARNAVKNAGMLAGIELKPHDLRRHAATYASRSGTPIEIISKVILRHSNLSTTQRYLGKVSDIEAVKWIENLYG